MRVCSMRIIVCLWLAAGAMLQAKVVELGFPELQYRVKVSLPEGHDASQKYPVLLYYHGTGGKPDTSLMRHHTGDRRWIVVGMTYYQLGKFTMTRETMAKEMTLLRSVKRHLQTKYGMDPSRCYVAGFSKGGWMADMFLQADSSLAGGVILGAGHLHKYHKTPVKYRKRKPVFIGVGRLDGNYPFALKGILHHRKVGAHTTLEAWPDIGHSFPRDGSEALTQWLALRSLTKPALNQAAKGETRKSYQDALEKSSVEQWRELKRIRDLPYAKLMGEEWNKTLAEQIKKLEASHPVKQEAMVLAKHRRLLYQEITDQSLQGLVKVHAGYQQLADKFSNTEQAKLAQHDQKRTATLIKHFQEQKKIAEEKKGDPFQPIKPKDPERKRRIPRNPLVR